MSRSPPPSPTSRSPSLSSSRATSSARSTREMTRLSALANRMEADLSGGSNNPADITLTRINISNIQDQPSATSARPRSTSLDHPGPSSAPINPQDSASTDPSGHADLLTRLINAAQPGAAPFEARSQPASNDNQCVIGKMTDILVRKEELKIKAILLNTEKWDRPTKSERCCHGEFIRPPCSQDLDLDRTRDGFCELARHLERARGMHARVIDASQVGAAPFEASSQPASIDIQCKIINMIENLLQQEELYIKSTVRYMDIWAQLLKISCNDMTIHEPTPTPHCLKHQREDLANTRYGYCEMARHLVREHDQVTDSSLHVPNCEMARQLVREHDQAIDSSLHGPSKRRKRSSN